MEVDVDLELVCESLLAAVELLKKALKPLQTFQIRH